MPFLTENATLIKRLAHLSNVSEIRDGTGLFLTSTPYRCWLDIDQATASRTPARATQLSLNASCSHYLVASEQPATRAARL